MHFVLKSSHARGDWSFLKHKNEIQKIIEKFAHKYGVKLNSMANVGNHLHLHLQLTNRFTYKPFIRAISAAIMMTVTGASRWRPLAGILRSKGLRPNTKFWNLRPFSRIVVSFKAVLNMRDYIQINKFEGLGYSREDSKFLVAWRWRGSGK
jgi:REP element-mobilizing transposase RayT